MSEAQFAMVSEWMPNGDINQFANAHPDVNRLELVSFRFRFRLPSFLANGSVVP